MYGQACMRVCVDFRLVSQTAHRHRIPISIECKKKKRFVCLWCIHNRIHWSLIHFDTVVSLNFLFTCVAGSADSAGVCPEAGNADPTDGGESPDCSESGEAENRSNRKGTALSHRSHTHMYIHIWTPLGHILLGHNTKFQSTVFLSNWVPTEIWL